MNFVNQVIKIKEIFYKKWGASVPKSEEATTMIDMIELIKTSIPSQLEGELITINDNKLLNKGINETWGK